MAPEVLTGCAYDPKVDIWGVGCVALELQTELRPWVGEKKDDVRLKLSKGQHPYLPWFGEEKVDMGGAEDLLRRAFTM